MIINKYACYIDMDESSEMIRVKSAYFKQLEDKAPASRVGSMFELMGLFNSFKNVSQIYVHGFKLAAKLAITWLVNLGYTHVNNKLEKLNYRTYIDNRGHVFKLSFRNEVGKVISIIDLKKIVPVETDKLYMFIGQEETSDPLKLTDYVAYTVNRLIDIGVDSMTIASSAMKDFKTLIGYANYDRLFPKLSEAQLRQLRYAYRGAFCYLNPEYVDVDIDEITAADENSMYSDKLNRCMLPIGAPIVFYGEPKRSHRHPLYVVTIQCAYDIKPDYIPTLQKSNDLDTREKEFIISSEGRIERLTLTNIDLELFLEHYEVDNLEYIQGYYFNASANIFSSYVKKWYEKKAEGKEKDDIFLYNISKLMQVSLVGRFASRARIETKLPEVQEDGSIILRACSVPNKERPYIPVAIFVNAYARRDVIKKAQRIYAQKMPDGRRAYIYSDTDSIVARTGAELNLDIDDYRLGAWKIKEYDQARFLRTKCYILKSMNELTIKCSGMPASYRNQVTWDNFKKGKKYKGKQSIKNEQGSYKIVESEFTLG